MRLSLFHIANPSSKAVQRNMSALIQATGHFLQCFTISVESLHVNGNFGAVQSKVLARSHILFDR